MKMKKIISVLCVFSLVLGMTACQKEESQEAKEQHAEGKTEKQDPMTISILWQQEVSEKFWDLPLKQFKEKYPDVKVEMESNAKASEVIRNLLNIGEAPDIFYSWISDVDYYGFAKEGLLYPVDDILKAKNAEETASLSDTIFKEGLALGELDQAHYFLPTSKLIAGNFYSGKLFEEKGWKVPQTWTEFDRLCETIKADGKTTPVIYAGVYPFMLADAFLMPMIHNIDAEALKAINNNEKGAWKLPATVEAVTRLQGMRDKGYLDKNSLAMDHIQSQIDFIAHNDAFVPSGSWLEGEMEDQWPEDFNLQPMYAPGEEAGKTATSAVVECMVLPKQKTDEKLEYIQELVRLFYSKENAEYVAKETGFLLALDKQDEKTTAQLPKSAQKMWSMADEKLTILTPSYKVRYKEVLTELNNCINALVQNEIDAKGFCDRMDKVAGEIKGE